MNGRRPVGWVIDQGGGRFTVSVDRALGSYPENGTPVYVEARGFVGAESLPPGVHRAADGTLLAKGDAVPAGWQAKNPNDEAPPNLWWSPGTKLYVRRWYEVRPVPEPETERVPWWEAVRDTRTLVLAGRTEPANDAWVAGDVRWVGRKDAYCQMPDADGMVEVLKDGPR